MELIVASAKGQLAVITDTFQRKIEKHISSAKDECHLIWRRYYVFMVLAHVI